MTPATPRQLDLLRFLASHLATNGTSPTFEQMRVGIGAESKSTVARLLDGLQERGHIRRLPGRHRAIELVGTALMDPADHALLAEVRAATADPLTDPVRVGGVLIPRRLARAIERPLARLAVMERRHSRALHEPVAGSATA